MKKTDQSISTTGNVGSVVRTVVILSIIYLVEEALGVPWKAVYLTALLFVIFVVIYRGMDS